MSYSKCAMPSLSCLLSFYTIPISFFFEFKDFFLFSSWRAGASQLSYNGHDFSVIGERERANLVVTTGTIFLSLYIYIYIYLSRAMPYRNRLRVSKLTQLTIFHRSSPRVYRHGDSFRRCTVATVQDEANPSSSQPAASCCVASESTEAHRGGWRQYVLAEESVLPRKQPKRKRGV